MIKHEHTVNLQYILPSSSQYQQSWMLLDIIENLVISFSYMNLTWILPKFTITAHERRRRRRSNSRIDFLLLFLLLLLTTKVHDRWSSVMNFGGRLGGRLWPVALSGRRRRRRRRMRGSSRSDYCWLTSSFQPDSWFIKSWLPTNGPMDQLRDGRTDWPTDGPTEERTNEQRLTYRRMDITS